MNQHSSVKRPVRLVQDVTAAIALALGVIVSAPVAARPAAAVVTDYLDALARKDRSAVESFLADDAVFEYPFDRSGKTEKGSWRVFSGRQAVMTGYVDGAFQRITTIKFTDREITQSADGHRVFVEALGDMSLAGKPYRNRYVLRFDLRHGRITGMKEYLNPVTGAIAAGVTTGAEEARR